MASEARTIGITGASGFIGSRLVPLLLKEGHHVRALCRHSLQNISGATAIQGDVQTVAAVRELVRGCSTVIHMAGIAHTTLRSQQEMSKAEGINVGGTLNILNEAIRAGVDRVLLASSAHVYSGQRGIQLDEGSPTAADSFYARTKLLLEKAGLEAAQSSRIAIVIARPCLTYGPGARFNLESLMKAIRRHYYFHISGESPLRSFLSVNNAAAALIHLAENGVSGGIYNVADPYPVALVDFVNALADRMGISRPGTLPQSMIRAAIAVASPLRWAGLLRSINSESLRKLTADFTLDVGALAGTGFTWPDDGKATRDKMVDAYLRLGHNGIE